jgi:hypothetical protein
MKYLLLVLTAMAGILSPAMGQSVSTVTAPQRGTVLVQSYAPAGQQTQVVDYSTQVAAPAATYTSPVQDESYRLQLQQQSYALEAQRMAAEQEARMRELHIQNAAAQAAANERLLAYEQEVIRQREASGRISLTGQRLAVAQEGISTVHQAATLVQHGLLGQKVKPGHVFAAQVLQGGGGGWGGAAFKNEQYARSVAGMATLPPVLTHILGR